jgi:bla regulator protein blaR1
MIADVLAWLVQGALASTVALLCVLALRLPVRRLFGARVAYGLWLLVPVALLAVSLPGPAMEVATDAANTVDAGAGPSVRVGLATALQPMVSAAMTPRPAAPGWLLLAWACGVVAMALWMWRLQRRFVSGLGPLAARGDGMFEAASASASPAVIGAWKPRIVLPADFDARYPAGEGTLVIAHEREHVSRGDVRINLFVVVLRCLYWFNPLLHWAAAKFRFDQELACDAAVLARHPDSRRAYAGAMLKTQLAVLGLPVGCHWQSSQSLKERILMLKKPLPGAWRRRGGIAAVAAALAVSSYGVWALQPGASVAAPALIGQVNDEAIAVAEVHVPQDISDQIWMQGPSMYGDPDSNSTRVYLVEHFDLTIESNTERPWKLEMRGAGSFQSPRVRWMLTQGTHVLQQEERPLGAAPVRIDLSAVADGAQSMPQIAVTRMSADRVMRSGRSAATHGEDKTMTRDADGVYRRAVPTMAFGDDYGANGGRATLLLDVGADGRVRHVDIEHAEPAGSLSRTQATELVGKHVYAPRIVDGKAVPSRIRVPVEVWKDSPPQIEPALVTPTSTSATTSTPAPAYPAQALAARQGGFVRLHLLVAVDGSVKEARIAQSHPIGVFDVVSIEAAKQWKLQPQMKDGKLVEGWVQVPITFEPDRKPEAPNGGGNQQG